jgi:DNA-binding IclR family transcriptional regulator
MAPNGQALGAELERDTITEERSGQVRSVLKALALLESLAAAGTDGITLSELSRRHDLHPSTTHRLLQTLLEAGYAHQQPATRRYQAGSALARLVGSPAPQIDDRGLRAAALSVMQRLSEQVEECVSLSLLDEGEVLLLSRTGSAVPLQMSTGGRVPAYCTAAGKALLAALDTETLEQLLPRMQLVRRTANTITDSEEFALELDRVRRRGYAANDEELQPGVRCVAAVIRDAAGRGAAALAISGTTARLNVHHFADLALNVQQSAALISRLWQSSISSDEK